MENMFCRQCEQTKDGKGCVKLGVCGKNPEVAALQDLLIYALKGAGFYGQKARALGVADKEADMFIAEGLFSTVTNVDFDAEALKTLVLKAYDIKERLKMKFEAAHQTKHGAAFPGAVPPEAAWKPAETKDGLLEQAKAAGVMANTDLSEDVRSLKELLLYGLKGMAAYADHARILGREDETVTAFFYKALAALADNSLKAEELLFLVLEFGKVNLKCLELLDAANTGAYGHPVPTKVSLGARKGPAILVSGHDLLDLKELLEQTEGKGINIYTHGEMLPAHGYPGLNKHKHLAGHYGTAWQNQYKEFADFPGAILMTTNCIQRPAAAYAARIFTTGLVRWPGVMHIDRVNGKKDFSALIDAALKAGGYAKDSPGKEIMVGFGRNAILGAADKVIAAVKAGKIKHFFLVGGCDGAKPGRNYYTEFAQKAPADTVILTLACGKFRFNMFDFGEIEGIPRLLDCGQCNDAYSAIVVATELAKAFKCGVNELPLSLVLSWYEQKAVCILLTLLALGIKNIRLGPSLPAFASHNVLKLLVNKFAIKPITTADKDLSEILGVKSA